MGRKVIGAENGTKDEWEEKDERKKRRNCATGIKRKENKVKKMKDEKKGKVWRILTCS